jgi:isoquinoline 1-oxidoreductase beta subunit
VSGKITFTGGAVDQSNYDDYPILTYDECPDIKIEILSSNEKVGGVGEVGIAACAPALCNAIFAASGKRMRVLPIKG